jgi:hypothetical protein
MKDRLEPLPPDVAAALGAERSRPGVDPATRALLRAKFHASLLAGQSDGPPPGEADRTTPWNDETLAAARGVWRALRRTNPLATALVGFGIGVATGVAVHAGLARRDLAPRPVPGLEAAPTPAPIEPARPPTPLPDEHAVVPGPASPSSVPSATDVRGASEAPVPSSSTLTAERALLDVAHSALGKGQAADALDALGRHARRFPRGVYREEREALTIQTLHALGRLDEAERLAAQFKTRYPRSLFLSIVEPATGTNR